jgi:hypothetical protein
VVKPIWIVDDEMHRAAGAVALQAGQAEAFRHHALAGEGGVAVDQQRHHHGAVLRRRAMLVLLGAHLAEHHRIDDLQMRRVGRQRQMHLVAVELAVGRGARGDTSRRPEPSISSGVPSRP